MTWRCMKCGWEAGLWGSLNSQRRVRCLGPFYRSRYCSQSTLTYTRIGGVIYVYIHMHMCGLSGGHICIHTFTLELSGHYSSPGSAWLNLSTLRM